MQGLLLLLMMGLTGAALAFPWYAGGDNIRGAKYLQPEERKAHVARMQSFHTFAECRAYMDEHNRMVDERAQAQGEKLPPMQGDPCAVMRGMGRIK